MHATKCYRRLAMIPAPLLAALLALSPAPVNAMASAMDEPPAPTLSESTDADYQAAVASVRAAQQLANEDPARGATKLRDAITVLQSHGSKLATDADAQDLRTMAQLTLARALLASDDADGARGVMDDALRTSRGDPLPTKNFGPGLVALHRERASVLGKQGTGTLVVECLIPCRVFIDERPAQQRAAGLVLGHYRLLIEANDGSQPALHKIFDIEHDGQVVEFGFGQVADTPIITDEQPITPNKPRTRLLPRWADILLMSAGAAAIGTGAALLAINGSCPKGADPNDTAACPQVYTTRTAGIATLAAGSALFVSGTVLLTVDEIRVGRQRGAQASLVWTFRF